MSYLLDTNVISELRKGERCHESVAAWFSTVADDEIFFSVLTIGELQKGIENLRRRDARTASVLEAWYLQILQDYSDRILPVDLNVVDEWARMNVPNPRPVLDSMLAATAKVHGLVLVTRDVTAIARTGVEFLNPWTV